MAIDADADAVTRMVAAIKGAMGSMASPTAEPPKQLFHYTDAAGFRGIVQDQVLWATDYRFLNDALEGEYGLALIQRELERAAARYDGHVEREFLVRSLASFATKMPLGQSFFLTCFCEADNLLSQWRAYGGAAASYSLGFNWWPQYPRHHGAFLRVIYNEDEQVEIIRAHIDAVARELNRFKAGDDVASNNTLIAIACSDLMGWLGRHVIRFKHPDFSEEREWRLVFVSPDRQHIKYRPSRFGLTPYVVSPPPRDLRHALRTVRIGPSPNPELMKLSAEGLLHGLPAARVEVSGTPLRV